MPEFVAQVRGHRVVTGQGFGDLLGQRPIQTPTAGLIALTVFDIAIVALTVREYRHQRGLRPAAPDPAADQFPG